MWSGGGGGLQLDARAIIQSSSLLSLSFSLCVSLISPKKNFVTYLAGRHVGKKQVQHDRLKVKTRVFPQFRR